jgi:hypothetical protein
MGSERRPTERRRSGASSTSILELARPNVPRLVCQPAEDFLSAAEERLGCSPEPVRLSAAEAGAVTTFAGSNDEVELLAGTADSPGDRLATEADNSPENRLTSASRPFSRNRSRGEFPNELRSSGLAPCARRILAISKFPLLFSLC